MHYPLGAAFGESGWEREASHEGLAVGGRLWSAHARPSS